MSQETTQYARPFDHSPKAMKATGEIYGNPALAFEQNGQLYNSAYTPVDAKGRPMPIDPKYLAPQPAKAAPTPQPQGNPDDDDDPDPELEMAQVNLMGWARNEVGSDYPWATIQAAIAERFNAGRPRSRADAIALIEKHMGPVNEGSPDERVDE